MSARTLRRSYVPVWLLAILVGTTLTSKGDAQSCCSGGGCSKSEPKDRSSGGGGSDKPSPEPYGGQLFCPVTGEKLGLRRPPVPVQTAIGEKKPAMLAKLFGKKGTPGMVIYVCCPDCVATVKSDPQTYLVEVIADRSCFVCSYGNAQAQRPLRIRTDLGQAPDIQAVVAYGGQRTCPVTGAKLGSIGPAVPVSYQGRTVYVCCQACVATVQRDPETYLRKTSAEQTGQPR